MRATDYFFCSGPAPVLLGVLQEHATPKSLKRMTVLGFPAPSDEQPSTAIHPFSHARCGAVSPAVGTSGNPLALASTSLNGGVETHDGHVDALDGGLLVREVPASPNGLADPRVR